MFVVSATAMFGSVSVRRMVTAVGVPGAGCRVLPALNYVSVFVPSVKSFCARSPSVGGHGCVQSTYKDYEGTK